MAVVEEAPTAAGEDFTAEEVAATMVAGDTVAIMEADTPEAGITAAAVATTAGMADTMAAMAVITVGTGDITAADTTAATVMDGDSVLDSTGEVIGLMGIVPSGFLLTIHTITLTTTMFHPAI